MKQIPSVLLLLLPLALMATSSFGETSYSAEPTAADLQETTAETVPAQPSVPAQNGALEPATREMTESQNAATDRVVPEAARIVQNESITAHNSILSFYGHPNSKRMGILGEHSKEELLAQMKKLALEYDVCNGDRGVVLAFHIIYGTVWPGGDIGHLSDRDLLPYIEFARRNGVLVFIDHQLGKGDVKTAIKRMLPYLVYENVHLAIDPEWHTPEPGIKLGSITAAELNAAQEMMSEYITENGIVGKRMLMVHQFNYTMIRNRENVRADYANVDLIHNADGFGNPGQKRGSYNYNAEAGNIPLKGFKLFLPTAQRNWGWDSPLMLPAEVMKLEPQPVLIMYQ